VDDGGEFFGIVDVRRETATVHGVYALFCVVGVDVVLTGEDAASGVV
jgi:hypothetical protein